MSLMCWWKTELNLFLKLELLKDTQMQCLQTLKFSYCHLGMKGKLPAQVDNGNIMFIALN